ncbi:hypothetical protein FUT84_01565 [Treponema phagedenis]|nr:hypothetical protein FUT84_01565 [Treponema phagedenis]QEK07455.1 hypothetical protein FUT80_12470 [Treponema phagedenis]
MAKRRQIINALPCGKFTHRCQNQNGHGTPVVPRRNDVLKAQTFSKCFYNSWFSFCHGQQKLNRCVGLFLRIEALKLVGKAEANY